MKLPALPWIIAAVMFAGILATYETCPGCIDRTRANGSCEWRGDTPFDVDPLNAAHRRHLVADAHLAEELAVRHADGEFGRRYGVEHHGGLLDAGRFRRECLASMLQAIERTHNVTAAQVEVARAQRDLRFDAAVALLFVPFYTLGALRACRWVFRRFAPDERAARLVGLIVLSVPVALLGVLVFRLWGAVWETIRVGNGHIGTGIRSAAAATWARQVFDEHLIAALALFWLIALFRYRAAPGHVSHANAASHVSLLQ
jgi:hypothetical protein